MATKKKEAKITAKSITEELGVGPGHKLVFWTADKVFMDEHFKDVQAVAYTTGPTGTLSMHLRTNGEWETKSGITADRVMAEAHLDQFRWKARQKEERAKSKELAAQATMTEGERESLRQLVRYFYDLQKLRIQNGNRSDAIARMTSSEMDEAIEALTEVDQLASTLPEETAKQLTAESQFFGNQAFGLDILGKNALKEVEAFLERFPIYTEYLKHQKGIGPTMAGVIVSEINIAKAETPASLWKYAGLDVDNQTGKAVRRERGKKYGRNAFLKAKLVFVLAGSFLKQNSPWRAHYDNYKTRKQNTIVPVCMLCEGTGHPKLSAREQRMLEESGKEQELKVCWHCNGKGHDVPWGRGNAHVDAAAKRYMVKMFLIELYNVWRKLEGLPVAPTYAEAKLGIKHGDHAVLPVRQP